MSEAPSTTAPKRTPLYDRHVALGARVIDFGGWAMPVQYPTGILEEHRAVREAVGLFDVSHMGKFMVEGARAAEAVQRVVTNDVGKLHDGEAMYTCTCREDGGIVDDLIVYRITAERFVTIVNASTTAKDLAHFTKHIGALAEITDGSAGFALIAVQGPKALALCSEITGGAVPPRPFTFVRTEVGGKPRFVCRTGYTGEDGVEMMVPSFNAGEMWDLLLERGAKHGIRPIGLGARDTLRLEARLSLYGNDIDEDHNPIEAGLGWVVKGKGFVGEDAIAKVRASGPSRKLVGFKVRGRGIARHGYPILKDGQTVGVVTSGTVAPTVGGAVGLGYVPAALATAGTLLVVDCRGKPAEVEVVSGPFYKRPA